ncbi:hypothetical protein [Bacillus paranthracis]|uniref:hypothetical protein n=1 Tax=Bacillus paranthracis TaxID=2026186 RepID=UPI001583EC22|nr:hypothetical protein [Bacillus paranthracis]NUJ08506.1 hypothetical protein [Bacillus paranthracis]
MSKLIVLFLSLLLVLTSCSTSETSAKPNKNDNTNLSTKNEQVYSIELSLQDKSSINDKHLTFRIDENDIFKPTVSIKNDVPKDQRYRMFFLVNYMQHSVTYDQKNINFIDIDLKKNEERNIEVEIPNLQSGINDLIVILVRDPDNVLEQDKYVSTNLVYLLRRSVVIKGNEQVKNSPTYTTINTFNGNKSEDGSSRVSYLTTDDSKNKEESISTLSASAIKQINLIKGNQTNQTKYAIVSILGNKQIEVKSPFVEINGEGEFEVPLIQLPLNVENNNLITVVSTNPYTTNEKELVLQPVEFVSHLFSILNKK